jgi:hypothetical protein
VALATNRPFAVLFVDHEHSSACLSAQRFEQKALEAAVLDYFEIAFCRRVSSISRNSADQSMSARHSPPIPEGQACRSRPSPRRKY